MSSCFGDWRKIGPAAGILAVLFWCLTGMVGLTGGEAEQAAGDYDGLAPAVGLAVKEHCYRHPFGEVVTEGHAILGVEEENGVITVYTRASAGCFGFENGVFTKISGSGSIPTVLSFSRDSAGGYTLLAYKEPESGTDYDESILTLFPEKYWSRVRHGDSEYAALKQQQEAQAAAYLRTIGRDARVSADYVDKKLAKINVQASNRLLAMRDPFMARCPYWLGTREILENGSRYIYEKSLAKSSDGYDVVVYRQLTGDGSLVAERKYKIVGSEPQLMD